METVELVLSPEALAATAAGATTAEELMLIQVNDNEQYAMALNHLKTVRLLQREITAHYKPHVDDAHVTWKRLTGARADALAPLLRADVHLNGETARYMRLEQQKREAEEARLRELARKAEEDRRMAAAELAEQRGQTEAAERIISAPVAPPAVVLQSIVPKVAGVSHRIIWDFKIVEESAIPRRLMQPNLVAIRGMVRSLKERANIPGVEVFSRSTANVKG